MSRILKFVYIENTLTFTYYIFAALRSSKVGEQCEAIVRFPKLFEKYPFPILINSSFLKLAEFFQNGFVIVSKSKNRNALLLII